MNSLISKLLLISVCLLGVSCASNFSKKNRQPNIVIIYADDMGYGDMSCQNPESKIQTINLDKLASEGMRFTDGHSSSGICSPSRYSLLTGTYHWRRRHGIISAFGEPSFFKSDDVTIASMLNSIGYNTMAVGKWHLGWEWDSVKTLAGKEFEGKIANRPEHYDWTKTIPGGPVDRGFDYYFGDGTINFPPYCWFENDRVLEAPTEMLDLGEMQTKEGRWEFRAGPMVKGWNPYNVLPTLSKKVVELINKQGNEKPFFLYFALPAPHAPIIPNDEFDNKTKAGAYGDFVYQTDHIIGQVLKAIKDKGFEENTLIIFSADNGPERYAFDRIKNYNHHSMGELRGLKRDTWEGGHRIPFVVKWPNRIKPGSVSEETINQVDIMATIATIVGYNLSEDSAVDSYNLLPILNGEKHKTPLREATVQNTYKDRYAIRKGYWLLINSFSGEHCETPDWYYTDNGYVKYTKENDQGLLFNLKEDVAQVNNLYNDYPEKVKVMQALLNKYKQSGRSVPIIQPKK